MADESRSSNTSDSDSASESEVKQQSKCDQSAGNVFKNDGSFMEMFKKMQDERNKKDTSYFDKPNSSASSKQSAPSEVPEATHDTPSDTTPSEITSSQPARKPSVLSMVGKRRGGRILPTGMVKKPKKPDSAQEEGEQNDAWSRYLSEVRKYREQSCEEEGKRRPLVK